MSYFGPVSSIVTKGFNWGVSSVAEGWKVTKDLGTAVIDKAASAVEYAGQTYTQAKTYAAEKIGAGTEWAKEKVVEQQTAVAQKATRALLKDKDQRDRLVSKVDKRDRFSSTVVQPCPNGLTTHPDKRDGLYMGKDCPKTSEGKPAEGTKPAKCQCAKDGKPFPKVMFSNGINNTADVVCSTMHAIAESRCAEVIGIFNATYADPNLKAPERKLGDYKDAATGMLKGAGSGFMSGGIPGALGGAAKGGMSEVAIQEAGRLGVVQDVIDCISTINRSGAEAASSTLSREIVEATSKDPPDAMTIYLHSQGGLNGSAAIAQAKGELIDDTMRTMRRNGIEPERVEALATQSVEARLATLNVYTFGTLERGLPDGPTYHRYTNELDPVPKAIHEAQQSYVPDLIEHEPAGAAPVTRFKSAPGFNAIGAHGMQESYLPWLDKNQSQRPCC